MIRKSKGFTLIELLVVIAIIAVLAAILFPVFARAREQARAASCLANMKELGAAVAMYASDNDGGYPVPYWEYAATVPIPGWNRDPDWRPEFCGAWPYYGAADDYAKHATARGILDPYVKNSGVWKCPSDSGCSPNFKEGARFSSYKFRPWYIQGFMEGRGNMQGVNDTYLKDTARTFILSEMAPFHDYRPNPNAPAGWQILEMMPDVKVNLTFADGHSKCFAVSKAFMVWPYRAAGVMDYDDNWSHQGGIVKNGSFDPTLCGAGHGPYHGPAYGCPAGSECCMDIEP